MLIIQSGQDVYGISQDKTQLVKLSLSYDKYPTNPTPDSLNEGIAWFLDFLARKSLPYSILIHEEEGAGGTGGTATIVYIDVMSGNSKKGDPIAVYTICNSITMGKETDLERTLYEELT